jgi:DNA-binding NarL/FixJ family response regulator
MNKNFNYYTKDLNIVFAEDDDLVRTNLTMILKRFFKSVHDFPNGQEAFDYWLENKDTIDLIVTDITMPVMNGIELSRKVKEIDPEHKIIIVSAHNDIDKLFELINIGVDGFVTKPPQKEQMSKAFVKIGKILTERKELAEYQQKLEEQINLTHIAHRVLEHRMNQKAVLLNAVVTKSATPAHTPTPQPSAPVAHSEKSVVPSTREQLEQANIYLPPHTPPVEATKALSSEPEYLPDDVAEMRDIIDDIDYLVIKLFGSDGISSEFLELLEKLVGRYAKYSFILKSYQSFQFLSDKLFELSCVLREFLNPESKADVNMVGDFLECMTYSLLMFQSQVIEEKKVDPNFYDASLSNDIDTIINIITHKDVNHVEEDLIEFF